MLQSYVNSGIWFSGTLFQNNRDVDSMNIVVVMFVNTNNNNRKTLYIETQ